MTTPAPAVDQVGVYFDALAQRSEAGGSAAPGTDAARYARHQSDAAAIMGDVAGAAATPVPDGVDVCDGDGGCVSFTDVVTDQAGLVSTFAIGGQPLAGRIVGSGATVEQDGISVRVTSAYESTAGELLVVVEFSSGIGVGVELFGFASVVVGAGAGGIEAMGAWGMTSVPGFGTARQLLAFPAASPGGRLLISGLRDDGVDVAFDVGIPEPD
ncbi:MAG: hypothetical protein R8G01_14075 [Ilumatobacteraceae bacterium]|nr:hypothetical protein [Ilumatobacteraceae bacterium]